MDYVIRQETPADYATVENLTREAFWNVYRPGCLEHYVLHTFRGRPDFIPELSLVLEATEGGKLAAAALEATGSRIIAHVMFAWSKIDLDDGSERRIMTFGPISVHPRFQRQGYGKRLLEHAMDIARDMGAGALAMCGNIRFYGTCGFVVATTRGVRYADDPDGEAPYFLVKELSAGFLDGVKGSYKDPAGYFVDDAEADAFDRQFPPKRKEKRPGQLV